MSNSTAKTKRVIQRNLPITTTYKILGSKYISMEDGGVCCDNCGKFITNIAEIESKEGQRYNVGMDCAATLSGIKDDFNFNYVHKANFTTAKGVRALLLKYIKDGKIKELTFKTYEDDKNFFKEVGAGCWDAALIPHGYNWKQYPKEVWNNYVLPMIKDLKL